MLLKHQITNKSLDDLKLAIVGLGYVGLPLATSFGKKRKVIGFDTNIERISELVIGRDSTLEVSSKEIKKSINLSFSNNLSDIEACNCFIVTVPTPIDINKKPDLTPLQSATNSIGSILKKGDIVIYESTVYPGATEEIAVPILESLSNLQFNKDFFIGYSPERINPGDKNHRLESIVKVTSGSNPETAKLIDNLYRSIITAGTHMAPSIRIAEAAKVIENTQRDVNIALINELSIIFNKLGIDSEAVLNAADTKWNFLPFKPGLVGGHCIGVDPYYLTYKAQEIGYDPKIILAGRHLNDEMGNYVVDQLTKRMIAEEMDLNKSRVLIMGVTFKENCPDMRNSKVIDVINGLKKLHVQVDCLDPWVSNKNTGNFSDINFIDKAVNKSYDAIILAVAHKEFCNMDIKDIRILGKEKHLIYDLKYIFSASETDLRL